MKKSAHFLAAACLCVLSLPAVAQDETPEAGTVLATVGTQEITLGHAIAMRAALPEQFRDVPDETLFPAIVEQLIEQELLNQFHADDLSLRERVTLENENRNFVANSALMAAAEAAVTDDTIQQAYDAFAAQFDEGEPQTEYNAAHILVETEEEIQSIVADLDGGADFADLAAEHSIDGSSAEGGDLGWFSEGMMIEPFEEAVMALEPGQISDPVETRFGWHVIHLKDTRTASVPELDEVREDLTNEIQREAARALLSRLRDDAEIDNRSDSVDPEHLGRTELLDE
ncbi:MAG: peptidyl-prolyl cis-trans isomerase C [Rhodobacteraceae bacterium HLUCCA12]|nr:MAG: peptidyl-prolyl cis-trans isomerase C [Rhodobacteraceae bacterium HLUCCA12]